MRVIGIDPGKWALGVGVGRVDPDGAPLLVHACASVVSQTKAKARGARIRIHEAQLGYLRGTADLVVIEEMEVHAGRTKRPADLIELTAVAAAVGEYLRKPNGRLLWLTVRAWKGGESKRINHARTIKALSETERERLDVGIQAAPNPNAKEILDAVGIMRAGSKYA